MKTWAVVVDKGSSTQIGIGELVYAKLTMRGRVLWATPDDSKSSFYIAKVKLVDYPRQFSQEEVDVSLMCFPELGDYL